MRFIYSGKIRGQGRPRFNMHSGSAYEAKADKEYKAAIRAAYVAADGVHFGDAPITMSIHVFRALPKSAPKRVKAAPDTGRPDVDNIAKAIMDALTGVAYADDSQVVQLRCVKHARLRRDEYVQIDIFQVVGGIYDE